ISQEEISAMIDNNDIQLTGEYFKRFPDYQVAFYIKSGDSYWVYLNPIGKKDELRLVPLLKQGDTYKMRVLESDPVNGPDPFAEDILSSPATQTVLLRQLQR